MSLATILLSCYNNLSPYALAFILKSTNNRGHVTDGTPHHPTFPQASNVIGSGQNHISHTYSFIHKRASLAALDRPTFSQSSSLKKSLVCCPWCLFNMLRYHKTKNLNYITGSDLLPWRAFFFFFFFSFFNLRSLPSLYFRLRFKKIKMEKRGKRLWPMEETGRGLLEGGIQTKS